MRSVYFAALCLSLWSVEGDVHQATDNMALIKVAVHCSAAVS